MNTRSAAIVSSAWSVIAPGMVPGWISGWRMRPMGVAWLPLSRRKDAGAGSAADVVDQGGS